MNGYIINTQPAWFTNFIEKSYGAKNIIFWNKSAKLPTNSIVKGTFFFHRLKGTKKIEGVSIVHQIEILPLSEAWKKYGNSLGYDSMQKIIDASSKMEGEKSLSEDSPILCIVLTGLFQCALDITVELPKLGINFGIYPNLPTVGKSLTEEETKRLLGRVKYPIIFEKYFILRNGSGGYNDEKGRIYHFKEGIPGNVQLRNGEKKAKFVYLENGFFSGQGEIGEIISKLENGIKNYYATIENYRDFEKKTALDKIRSILSKQMTQAGIIEISEEDFNKILNASASVIQPLESETRIDQIEGSVSINLTPSMFQTSLTLPNELMAQICSTINCGNHLIITGPVGTGKTTVSEDVCKVAKKGGYCDGCILTTASSDWTTFDTIGGYMPGIDGRLKFEEGKFLEAIRQNKWLIIDEINRADIDKAFGQLFTVLSGQSVELPFKNSNGKSISIKTTEENLSFFDQATATYKVGKNWRIIATMNIYDMNFLFEMSYAFMRRFAFIYMGLPEKTENLIKDWCSNRNLSEDTAIKLFTLTSLAGRKFGPAITKDMVDYLQIRGDGETELAEAIISYILPQLEGLDKEKIEEAWKQVLNLFNDKSIPNTKMLPILQELTGIEIKPA